MAYPDYEEFIAALNEHGVKYLIVGAHAVAATGLPPRASPHKAHLCDIDRRPSPLENPIRPPEAVRVHLDVELLVDILADYHFSKEEKARMENV